MGFIEIIHERVVQYTKQHQARVESTQNKDAMPANTFGPHLKSVPQKLRHDLNCMYRQIKRASRIIQDTI